MAKIRGRLIRIVDPRTVIINLGDKDGVKPNSIFSILAEPEDIIDPLTEENLGTLTVVKAKVVAAQVFERFTIAKTRWVISRFKNGDLEKELRLFPIIETEGLAAEDLFVKPAEVKPWQAQSEVPVQVGDVVEVIVEEKKLPAVTNSLHYHLASKSQTESETLRHNSGD